MNSPKISVVMPAYNHERYVGVTVESVLNQTFTDLELVVIDDGSTDRTGEVVQSFSGDKRLRYIKQENQDAYNALNRGMSEAKGEFIAIINSDDIYEPTRLERLMAEQQKTGAACLFTDVQPVDSAGARITSPNHGWLIWHEKNRKLYFEHNDLYTAFLNGNFLVTSSNFFFTREVYEKTGGFAALRYLHDYDYIFRIILGFPGKVVYLHDAKLVNYRIHASNTLGQGAIVAREQDLLVIEKYMLAGLPEEYKKAVAIGSNRLRVLERELCVERNRAATANACGLSGFRCPGIMVLKKMGELMRRLAAKFRR
ncbi:MAG: glycosyltransferase [Lentisphaerae bacterium]|nr:glycosyltransferase [Lentisphaerota bacterium]